MDASLCYVERPAAVGDRKIKILRNKEIPLVLIQWQPRKRSKVSREAETCDAGAASRIIFRARLRGRSLILVGENCNSPKSQVLLNCILGCFKGETRRVGARLAE